MQGQLARIPNLREAVYTALVGCLPSSQQPIKIALSGEIGSSALIRSVCDAVVIGIRKPARVRGRIR
jgi:hypothetical protein